MCPTSSSSSSSSNDAYFFSYHHCSENIAWPSISSVDENFVTQLGWTIHREDDNENRWFMYKYVIHLFEKRATIML